jgi:formylglycine-generating enzyme required for sulfatase activity/tRNA A-37 threonylcarbamoyl transferase component Bud32
MSSAAEPTAAFVAAIRQSNLLTAAQLDDLDGWVARHTPDVPTLAKELHHRGWLTPYQIKEVFKGRGKDLRMGQFVLLELLGEGGMGKVYKAHQTRLGRDVALKVIRKEKLNNPAALARFHQEIQAVAKMSHPNVVTAYDADQVGELHFVVMELIDGSDLTRLVRDRGPLPIPEACECIRQAALGLHHAHEQGLIHRDIKPSNILVGRGRQVKLVDLGLARLMDEQPGQEEAGRITQEGFVIGTPDFLAPEQARNPAGVDIRADIYALGGTLFYILTGKVPYDGANPTEKLLRHCTDPPPRLLPHRPDAPPQLEQLIHWAMAKRAEDRPQTPMQLALALQPFCPPPVVGSGAIPMPVSGGYAAPAPAWPIPPQPLELPAEEPADPARSSQIFKLPPTTTAPVRRPRAKAGFPTGMLLLALGGVLLIGILGYATYRSFLGGGRVLGPVETFTSSVGMKMVRLEGGTFRMGSPDGEPGRAKDDEGPVHEVAIRGPFLMAATEVTHGQFLQVMGVSPSRVGGRAASPTDFPVERVTYDEAVEFCQKLTAKEREQKWVRDGWAYRLPTEAEWEYACRAGTTTAYFFGDRLTSPKQARFVAEGKASPDQDLPGKVGQTEPNAWGLFDMSGNVAEWCLDYYRRGYPADGPRENPLGPADGDRRVVRGGSFRDPPAAGRSAARAGLRNYERKDFVGFRVVYAPK